MSAFLHDESHVSVDLFWLYELVVQLLVGLGQLRVIQYAPLGRGMMSELFTKI